MNWNELKQFTQARIGLERCGHSVSTRSQLEFQWAHACARDAVFETWDAEATEQELGAAGMQTIRLETQVSQRTDYLRRPDLGRKLKEDSEALLQLKQPAVPHRLVFVMTDGLSPAAIRAHGAALATRLSQTLADFIRGPKPLWILAPFGRVALSDAIGEKLKAEMVCMVLGERPGLSSPNSAALYLTYRPKVGNSDALRNCISNIHPPDGLSYAEAVHKAHFLVAEAFRRKYTGVELKDESASFRADLDDLN